MKTNMIIRLSTGRLMVVSMLVFFTLAFPLKAQQDKKVTGSKITEKSFPFISMIRENKDLLKITGNDQVLKKQVLRQREKITASLKECGDAGCLASSIQFEPGDINAIGNELVRLYTEKAEFRNFISKLKDSDYYIMYESDFDTTFVRAVWKSVATGINQALGVYIKGERPRYFNIDAISFAPGDEKFLSIIRNDLRKELDNRENSSFFDIPINMVVNAMLVNERDEAARYEPLTEGMNKDPFESIAGINWDKYNYSVLLVPGEGPSVEGVNIDPKSINRCKLAAQKYNEGVVPFILVSGGQVHPNKTPFSEAVEMKKYLVNDLNIPGRAVIIDPHARHTTTNMRNAARIVYKFNLPSDKKILITTDSLQNAFLLSMERRFKMELGCLPYRDLKKLDVESSEYYPVRNALQVNSLDPLDP